MVQKRLRGRWGKLGIDSKSRNWLKDEFPITKNLLEELVTEGKLSWEQLIKRFKDNKYKLFDIPKNLGQIARLGRDIRRRKEKMKTTDDPRYFEECKKLIASWEHEAKQRKWLVKAVSKKVDISNKGAIRHQNRKGQKSPYLYFRVYWWGKKRVAYLGEESQFKTAFKRQSKFKDYDKYLLDQGRKAFLKKLGESAFRTDSSILQKKLYQERLLDQV